MLCMWKDSGVGGNKDDKIGFTLGACVLCLEVH